MGMMHFKPTILQVDLLGMGINLDHSTVLTKASLVLGNGVGHSNPDTTSTTYSRELEGGIGAPVASHFVEDDIFGQQLQVRGGHTLANPGSVHLARGHSPDLEVVRAHEDLIQLLTDIAGVPDVKVLWLVRGRTSASLQGSVNQTTNAFDLLLLWQDRNVVLERVGNPAALIADIGDTLVLVPVLGLGKGFIEAIVEILVVGENNMSTDIKQLHRNQY